MLQLHFHSTDDLDLHSGSTPLVNSKLHCCVVAATFSFLD